MPPLSFPELVRLAALRLSLSKTDLARILHVDRAAIYLCLQGGEGHFDALCRERLCLLGTLAEEISRETPRPLYRRFVHEAMPSEAKSILQLLEEEEWQTSLLRSLFHKARDLTTRRDERLGAHIPHTPLTAAEEEANYWDNLLSLGGE